MSVATEVNNTSSVRPKDRLVLRDLACSVAEIAALPIQAERIELWKAMNRLAPVRPLVAAYPERSWKELIPRDAMQCEAKELRGWEYQLRQVMYHYCGNHYSK